MDRCHQWTNWKNLNDIIIFNPSALTNEASFLKEKYINEGWSTSEIARYCKCSKAKVLSKLEQFGIEPRHHVRQMSYGKKLDKHGRLVPYAKEMKVIQFIIKLRKEGLSYHKIGQHLDTLGIPTKRGKKWHHFTVSKIYHDNIKNLTQDCN